MAVDFLSVAEDELVEAVSYYSQQSDGLGFDFAAEVRQTIDRIVEYPLAWPMLSRRTRRCRMRRFPHGIVCQQRGELILIVAIMHLRRHPDSWKDRPVSGETRL